LKPRIFLQFLQRFSAVISKAFDNMCYAELFQCVVDTRVPGWIVLVIENWYSKLCVTVRWIDAISGFFNVMSGVRQGSILSPRLFTVLINIVIVNLRDSGGGCSITVFLLDVFFMPMISLSYQLLPVVCKKC